MDYFNTQSQQKHLPRYHNKKRLTPDQVRLLERTFTSNKKLDPELKLHLANQLGVPPRQVAIWYQNKRARWKTQSLALDYGTLQASLEEALGEKRRLEREVLQLHEELRKAHDILSALSPPLPSHHPPPPPPPLSNNASNCNSSCDDGGSSSLHNEDVNGHDEVLQLDELYACLIGGGSTWSQ
ncbi:hypothetical protein K2173_011935 [Erythroxylum novogranatense]|uniref:Homeobox-leucine zipper protein n=1 Tax=Erythroxylum novogranatense TaxID=1862640 RepID=A0AAV8TGS6_9ROSI|nr:hypothetical protein K2173_011935 [Erythroxylum novogranatense]